MAVKCKMPNCGSYTNHADGLCGFHYRMGAKLAAALDAEQLDPEEKERARLRASQTFEKFTVRREEERQQEDANYARIRESVREAVRVTLGEGLSREVFDSLRQVQSELKQARLRRAQRDELWRALQEGFDNEKRKQDEQREAHRAACEQNRHHFGNRISRLETDAGVTTDFRQVRDSLRGLQEEMRNYPLSREDRNAFRSRLQRVFETISTRQDEARRRYAQACEANYARVYAQIAEACRLVDCGTDFRTAGDALKSAQQNLREVRPIAREGREDLRDRINRAFGVLKTRRDAYFAEKERERAARARERRQRMQEKIGRLEERIRRLNEIQRNTESSMVRDTDYINSLHGQIGRVRPGRKAADIYRNLNRKIEEVGARRSDKHKKLDELRRETARLEDEIRRLQNESRR